MCIRNFSVILIFSVLIPCSVFAWNSSNTGKCYTMDSLCLLSDSIQFNAAEHLYEVDCDIVIREQDTLRIKPGETIKFLWLLIPGDQIRRKLVIYGTLRAIGTETDPIVLGDPMCTLSSGVWWDGILFIHTSSDGESIMKYCEIRGATHFDIELMTSIFCDNSSPIIDHCTIQYLGSSELTGGASAIGLRGNSYPIILYTTFKNILNGVAIWCNVMLNQDTINYPSPSMVGCNIMSSVTGVVYPPLDNNYVVISGGFLDNCYLGSYFNIADTTLGTPLDTIGDGICKTTSTFPLKPRFYMVDGVSQPRNTPYITGINEEEIGVLPTTSARLLLHTNYPNPLSSSTTIVFEVKQKAARISLRIYDSKGNWIKTILDQKTLAPGSYSELWYGDDANGNKISTGIYFYRLESDEMLLEKKAIVVK